jgi:hypothetical protein
MGCCWFRQCTGIVIDRASKPAILVTPFAVCAIGANFADDRENESRSVVASRNSPRPLVCGRINPAGLVSVQNCADA